MAHKLTLEQDLIDLGWHQKEFQLRSSFAYTVVSLDESRVLGCVYVNRSSNPEYDASVCLWVRQDELATGLDGALFTTVKEWIAQSWHFERVAYPGRELSWQELSGYDPTQAVLAAEQAWTQAHIDGDFAAIEQMMAEAYTHASTPTARSATKPKCSPAINHKAVNGTLPKAINTKCCSTVTLPP